MRRVKEKTVSKKRLLLLPVLLIAVGAALYSWNLGQDAPQAVDRLTLYGNVDLREVDLTFDAVGHVAEVLVQEGDAVVPGQVLARLHAEKPAAAVAAARAVVEAAEQALAKLEAGNRPQDIGIAQAQAEALQAKARAAQISYARLRKLAPQKLAAPEDVDQARAAAEAAEAEARADRKSVV